ncbi:MAG: hypothetical protein A2832_02285 [Candidatus Zambryskibacteria bacterium RIFCSPHIGHO2_01_FULL_44_22b]|uniref:Uncharacterized protein n=2 Tax=Parcubacteria group TaxID=1794811 RepID=A0A1G2T135_9BACT|nr:MAG: hypothetical protein A3B19_01890 [Candidatus Giovannonibacteria bacterium RIFCSPLOWO2_01_FULL_46_32]OHA90944.1 MAG: hypothetical protein A2832_02285 [Candidatus Zambryskibacteria bacterium RIFCSPHIGHO2_01_FULL_44_22b]
MDDETIKDDELEPRPASDESTEEELIKPKSLLDDEAVESADDLAEEELDVEEPFDDVNET